MNEYTFRMRTQVVVAFGLLGCAHVDHPAAATHSAPIPRMKPAQVVVVPVDFRPVPEAYSLFSRDGRFAFELGFLYDRGDCSPRARLSEGTIGALPEGTNGGWEPEGDVNDAEAMAAFAAYRPPDESYSCSPTLVDPVARLLAMKCVHQGPEYSIEDDDWAVALGTGQKAAPLCLAAAERSDIRETFGDDVRWSAQRDAFTFLEQSEGWNYRTRIIHVIDLRAETEETIDDSDAAERREDPSYGGIKGFEPPVTAVPHKEEIVPMTVTFDALSQSVFVQRADGEKRRVFDDHLWPSDEGAEAPWSGVTPRHRFRTSVDPFGGALLSYEAIERAFVVPGLFHRFVRGERLPCRPSPNVDLPPKLVVTARKGAVDAVAEDMGGGLAEVVVTRDGKNEVIVRAPRGLGSTISVDAKTSDVVSVAACTSARGGSCTIEHAVRPPVTSGHKP